MHSVALGLLLYGAEPDQKTRIERADAKPSAMVAAADMRAFCMVLGIVKPMKSRKSWPLITPDGRIFAGASPALWIIAGALDALLFGERFVKVKPGEHVFYDDCA